MDFIVVDSLCIGFLVFGLKHIGQLGVLFWFFVENMTMV
jgi:hypothetical protein